MTGSRALSERCPEISPLLGVVDAELVSPNSARFRGLSSEHAVTEAKRRVVANLIRDPQCVFVFPEDPTKLVASASTWTRFGSIHWKLGDPSVVDMIYRDIFLLGGWLVMVGGRLITQAELENGRVHAPSGLQGIVEMAGARLGIYALEDDVQWLVSWTPEAA